jgi:hypothetical protein
MKLRESRLRLRKRLLDQEYVDRLIALIGRTAFYQKFAVVERNLTR